MPADRLSSLACLRSCSSDGRAGRRAIGSDTRSPFTDRPRPLLGATEDREVYLRRLVRWARPFPRTGCVLVRESKLIAGSADTQRWRGSAGLPPACARAREQRTPPSRAEWHL